MISKNIGNSGKHSRQNSIDIDQLAEAILNGERKALSKGITLVESDLDSDQALALELLTSLERHQYESKCIAITGPPGAGKSTCIESMGQLAIASGYRLAVLSIDPSSSLTKGSILGDKTRMPKLSADKRVFVRPSPSRGEVGGIGRRTFEVKRLCEAAGYNLIFIETVGVGQSEIEVSQLTDMVTVLVQPGSGDDIQGIKKGLNELSDFFIINKADGPQIDLAREARAHIISTMQFRQGQSRDMVSLHSSIDETMRRACWEAMMNRYDQLAGSEEITIRRNNQAIFWYEKNIERSIARWIQKRIQQDAENDKILKSIENKEVSVHQAVKLFMENFYSNYSG